MDAVTVIRRPHPHRKHVNRLLLDAAERLGEPELSRPRPIGQGSLRQTLLHLYGAEYVWLGALEGDADATTPGDVPGRLPGNQQGDGAVTTLADLRERWAALDARWDACLAGLTAEALDGTVVRVRRIAGGSPTPIGTSRADALLHVCTHAQYTVAQAVNMLRQAGMPAAELPDPMLITLARNERTAPNAV